MAVISSKSESVENKKNEVPKEIVFDLKSSDLDIEELNSNYLLKKAFESKASGMRLSTTINFVYYNGDEVIEKKISLSESPESPEDLYQFIAFGAKAHFTKLMIYDLNSKWELLIESSKKLANETLIEINKLKQEIEERKEKIQTLDPKQLSMLPEAIERPEEEAWLDAVIVNLKLYDEIKGDSVIFKIFVKARYDLTSFVISFNGKDYFTQFDLLMLYTKFDKLFYNYYSTKV